MQPIKADVADAFITSLEELADDRAALARFKRCAGQPLAECPSIYPLFYRSIPNEARGRSWMEEKLFLVATLFPFAPERGTSNVGQALRSVADGFSESADGVDRRFGILLDASADELPFRLRQAVAFLASHECRVDWRQLLRDLMNWDWPSRDVQKRWARAYFRAGTPASTITTTE